MTAAPLRDRDHPYVACPHGGCTLPANHDAAPAPTVDAALAQTIAIAIVELPNSGGLSWNEAQLVGEAVARRVVSL